MKSIDFLGQSLEQDIVKAIALGKIDPVTKEEFKTSEQDLRVVERICGRKQQTRHQQQPTHNFKTSVGKKAGRGKKQLTFDQSKIQTSFKQLGDKGMPMFLRQNPIPEWIDLWNQHPQVFWRKYWTEKKLGNLPANFEYGNFKGKGKKKKEPKEPKQKKAK